MNPNQCVPHWKINDVCQTNQQPLLPPLSLPLPLPLPLPPPPPTISKPSSSHSQPGVIFTDHNIPTQNHELAELAWENGYLTTNGLGLPRTSNTNDIESACGTLQAIVNQATHKPLPPLAPVGACDKNEVIVPFNNPKTIQPTSAPPNVCVTTDALVPNTSNRDVLSSKHVGICSTYLGSCSGVAPSMIGYSDLSVSVSTHRSVDDTYKYYSRSMTKGEIDSSFGASLDTTTRVLSFDNPEHDPVCHNAYKRKQADDEDNRKKETLSTKRSQKADIHNESERRRRDKINQKMKTLQELVPNSSKTDKASMLDEIIEYVKQLQVQVQILNTMRSSLMPLAIQQQQFLHMSMMASMGMRYGMGMNVDQLNTSTNTVGPSNIPGIPNIFLNPSTYMNTTAAINGADRVTPQSINMPVSDPVSMYLASQSPAMTTMEAYNKIASMCKQLEQQQQSENKKSDNK